MASVQYAPIMQWLLRPALLLVAALFGFFAGAWGASIVGLLIDLLFSALGLDPLGIAFFAQLIGAPLGLLLAMIWTAKQLRANT